MLVALGTTFVTSATAANRIVAMAYKDGSGNSVAMVTGSPAYTASQIYQTQVCSGNPGYNAGQNNLLATLTMPRLWLPAGYTINSLTAGIQAADQWENLLLALAHRKS
jgi:hypothetical protein